VEIITLGSAYALKANPLSVDVCPRSVAEAGADPDDVRKVVLFRRALESTRHTQLPDTARRHGADIITALRQAIMGTPGKPPLVAPT
jgi:hypothetical protein